MNFSYEEAVSAFIDKKMKEAKKMTTFEGNFTAKNIKELYSFDNSIVNDENKSYFNFFD